MKKRKVTRKRVKNPFLDLETKDKPGKDKKTRNFTFLYFIMAFVAIIVINSYLSTSEVKTIAYSEFKEDLAKGKISDVTVNSDTVQGTLKEDDGKPSSSGPPGWMIRISSRTCKKTT